MQKRRPKNRISVRIDKVSMTVVGCFLMNMEEARPGSLPDHWIRVAKQLRKAGLRRSLTGRAAIEIAREEAGVFGLQVLQGAEDILAFLRRYYGNPKAAALVVLHWVHVASKLYCAALPKKRGIKPRTHEQIRRTLFRDSILTHKDPSWQRRLKARLRTPPVKIPSILTE